MKKQLSTVLTLLTIAGFTSCQKENLTDTPATTTTARNALSNKQSPLRSVAEWETLFLNEWENGGYADALNRSQDTNSYRFYHINYAIDALVSMAEATGDITYLEQALTFAENMVATAKPSNLLPHKRYQNDSYLGWISLRPDTENRQVPLFESVCWRYVTRMLRVIRFTPAWFGQPGIRARYQALLDFTETHMFEKWWTREYGKPPHGAIYRGRTHMASHWAFIALDLSLLTQSQDKKALYESVVYAVDRDLPNYNTSLRGQMIAHPDDPAAYFWNADWNKSTELPGSDVSHGSHVISYIVEAAQFGTEWKASDLAKFTRLFDKILWPDSGVYASYVDGSLSDNVIITRAHDGWAKLGRYNADLQRRLEEGHEPSTPANAKMNSSQYYATGALNARILLDSAR